MSDANDNQTASECEETAPLAAKSSGGVFSWLTSSRSPTYSTTTSSTTGDITTHSATVTATAASTGSRSGSVSPAGTASPASGTRSPALSSSPPRSPARLMIPAFGGGGGRFGPTIMTHIGTPSVAHSHTEHPAVVTSTSTTTTSVSEHDDQQQESELPPGVVITAKTFGGETITTKTSPQHKNVSVVSTTTTTSATASDNQLEPLLNVTTTSTTAEPTRVVRYITTTTGSATHTPVASPMGASGVRYVKTTTSTSGGGVPVAMEGQERTEGGVRYITRTVGSATHTPVASPVAIGGGATSVRYVTTMGASPIGASGLHGGAASSVRFFPPQVQPPQVHTVTRVVNGQQVQVPMPVGEPHHHNVQYIARSVSPALSISSNVSSSSGSVVASSPVGAVEQRQQVRYITKTINHAQVPVQTQSSANSTTTQTVVGSGQGGGSGAVTMGGAAGSASLTSVSGGVPLRTVVASTLLNSSRNHTGLELGEEVEGLPAHFIGIQRTLTDTDSSDGEEHEVKMVFDIMSQSFKPVGKRRSRRSTAGAAAATATGASAGAATGEAAGVGGASGAAAAAVVAAGAVTGAAVVAAASGVAACAATGAGANTGAAAGAEAKADVDTNAGAAAIAVSGAAVTSIESETNADLEEKAPVAAVATETDASGKNEKNGAGLATAAAIGLTAAVAVGAAAAVAAGTKKPASPMMKLDTVATAGESAALSSTPGGPKKRTPSQTKREPSPRKFFSTTKASAAASQAPLLADESVTMDLEPGAHFAELRSPASHDGSRFAQVGLLLQVRKCRWLLITLVAVAIMIFLTVLFYKGVTLHKFQSTRYSLSKQYDMADSYNGYVALFTALLGKPIEMLASIVLPILTLTVSDSSMLATKLSSRLPIVLFILSFLVCYLLASSFHGINVQLRVQSSTPVIAVGDLSLQLAGAASLAGSGASVSLIAAAAANASSNASVIVSETVAKNAITNTVLRSVVELPEANSTSSLLCNNTVDYSALLGANAPSSLSSLWTTTMASYGFPMRSWQDEMLPGAMPEAKYTLKLSEKTTSNDVVLPMRVRTAANLFLHGVHVARDAFRWFDGKNTPLGVQEAVNAKYGTATNGKLTHVCVADLLGLTNASSSTAADDAASTPAFLNQVRSLFNRSLDGAANIARAESSLEFTSVSLPNGYTFESVTMEIPFITNFLSRRLTISGNTLVEEAAPANETDVYYDLNIATDCGPYAGACEVRRTEKDASANVFEPSTTVRAFALCNSSLGTDDLEVFFDGSKATKTVSYTCDGQLDSGMLVVSVSSRIVGEALIEGPSPDVPRLEDGQATLKNARKIYSLTVGKLSWPKTNLATAFHAACEAGVGKCTGLQYALTAALKNATETTASGNLRGAATTTQEENGDNQYLVVGDDYLPLKLLSAFDYNATEAAKQTVKTTESMSGYPLVTITKPVEADADFENDGDVIVAANFKTVSWTKARQGAFCSATVEARLNSVLNNHYYIERGVQPAYTAGMFFLFQDGVAKEQIALGLSSGSGLSTLRFASTIEFVALVASIPLLSAMLTLIGCGIIVLASLYVLVVSRRKIYTITSGGHDVGSDSVFSGHVAQETLARIKLNHPLYPPVVLHRRVIDLSTANHSTTTGTTALSPGAKTAESSHGHLGVEGESVDDFEVKGMQMEHERRDLSVDMAK